LQHGSPHQSWCHRIDSDTPAAQLFGQHFGQSNHSCLGSGVIRLTVKTCPGRNGGDVDNPPAVAQHFQAVLAAIKRSVQIRFHDAVPVVQRHVFDGAVAADTGIVDEDVETAKLTRDFPHHVRNSLSFTNIGLNNESAATALVQTRGQRFGIALIVSVGVCEVVDDALSAGLGKLFDQSFTQAARTPGYQNRFALEIPHR
jgi:hypothetical protein